MRKQKITVYILTTVLIILLVAVVFKISNHQQPGSLLRDDDQVIEVENQPAPRAPYDGNRDLPLALQIDNFIIENELDTDWFSYYITDLTTGETITLNEEEEFISASIYKLQIALLYYDDINEGIYSTDDLFRYDEWVGEIGGPVYELYSPGDYLDLEYLLNVMIELSDNTSAHILYSYRGGWSDMRHEALKYTDTPPMDNYYDGRNFLTSTYTNDLLMHIYTHQDEYPDLIDSMQNAQQTEFLNNSIHHITAQKTGNNDQGVGSVGIVFDENPYAISFLSHFDYNTGQWVMGEINRIVYEYYYEGAS